MKREEIIKKVVGIEWAFNGDTEHGADCIGLARRFYQLNGWKEDFKDGRPVEKGWYKTEPLRMLLWIAHNFDKEPNFSNLKYGDLVIMKINDEYHIGIALEYGKVLHTFPPLNELIKTVSHIERFRYLEPYFICGYKRRV